MSAHELDPTTRNGNHSSITISRLIQRQKANALKGFTVGIIITVAYFALATRNYESEAKIFVKVGRQTVALDPTANTGQPISVRESQNQEIFAVQELLASRSLAEAVVEKFGAEVILDGKSPGSDDEDSGFEIPSPGDLLKPLDGVNLNPLRVYSLEDKAVKTFGKNLTVLAGKQTNIIALAYESEDPAHSQEVLQTLIEMGREQHREMHNIRGSQDFFVKQADLLRTNLDDLETELSELKTETGIASLQTQRDNHLSLLDSLRQQKIVAESELKGLKTEIEQRRSRQGDFEETIVLESTTDQPQSVAQTLRARLYDLEVQEEDLASRATYSHPKRVQLRKQIAEARAIADDVGDRPSITRGLNKNFQATQLTLHEKETQASALETKITALTEDITKAECKLVELNQAELKINKLEREIALSSDNYKTYSENLEQARIDSEINSAGISSLNTMQEPTFVETPVNPKPSITLGLGLVMSMLLGAMLAVVREKKSQELEYSKRTAPDHPTVPGKPKFASDNGKPTPERVVEAAPAG